MSDSVSEQAKGKEVADYKVELLLGEFVDTVWDGITANPSIISILKRIGLGSPSSTGQKTAANSTSVVPGYATPGAATAINVTTSAVLIKAASTRVRITITNDSANILYISTTNTVTATNAATKGLAIAAYGGAISLNWQTDIYGIYATGSYYVTYVEET